MNILPRNTFSWNLLPPGFHLTLTLHIQNIWNLCPNLTQRKCQLRTARVSLCQLIWQSDLTKVRQWFKPQTCKYRAPVWLYLGWNSSTGKARYSQVNEVL